MSEQIKIKVATYNVGDYSGKGLPAGSEESRAAYKDIFAKVGADLWALQEDVEFFNKETGESAFDAVYSSVLPNYKRNYTGNYNGKAFLTTKACIVQTVTSAEIVPIIAPKAPSGGMSK